VILNTLVKSHLETYPKRRLKFAKIKRIIAQIIVGLKHVHKNGFIHRDIKDGNILMFRDGTIKLCDFGASFNESEKQKEPGSFCGTPKFMAPEVKK
jgi:serine/threonine protein kinase